MLAVIAFATQVLTLISTTLIIAEKLHKRRSLRRIEARANPRATNASNNSDQDDNDDRKRWSFLRLVGLFALLAAASNLVLLRLGPEHAAALTVGAAANIAVSLANAYMGFSLLRE